MDDCLKAKLVKKYGGECAVCGYKKCLAALHFHHINSFEKKFNISEKTRLDQELKEELKKCILLCANCHISYHQGLIETELLVDLKENLKCYNKVMIQQILTGLNFWLIVIFTGALVWLVRQTIPAKYEKRNWFRVLLKVVPVLIGAGM